MVFIISPIVGKYLTLLGVRNVFVVGLVLITIGTIMFAFVDITVQYVQFSSKILTSLGQYLLLLHVVLFV